jgi:hypothetical protein
MNSRRNSSARKLFSSAMRIGRDHIASTVYTIAFAYAGAALPILIIVMLYDRPLADTLTSAELSEEVIRTLVGSIGLVLAIPVTTLIAVLVVKATGSGAADVVGSGARETDDGGGPPSRGRVAAGARARAAVDPDDVADTGALAAQPSKPGGAAGPQNGVDGGGSGSTRRTAAPGIHDLPGFATMDR